MAWSWVLGSVDAADANWALEQHVCENRFFPTAADIIGRLRDRGARAIAGGDLPDWSVGWAEMVDAVARVGQYGDPAWSHPVIAEAVSRIGYRSFCVSLVAEQATWRAQYRQIHEQVVDRVRRSAREVAAAQLGGGATLTAIERSHAPEAAGTVVRQLLAWRQPGGAR